MIDKELARKVITDMKMEGTFYAKNV